MEQNYVIDRLIAEAVARNAGLFVLNERRKGFDIKMKGRNDIVTSIDIASEKRIKQLLNEACPNDTFMGEESGSDHDQSGRRWVIDPIDGTLNFSTGIPVFSISIALQIDGQSVAGAVYDPNQDELFSASKNGGAFLNGQPISVSQNDTFEHAVLVTGFPPTKDKGFNNINNFTKLCHKCRAIRRLGSAAIDLCYVAAGRIDGYWEFGLRPWDTAAGYLIVNEAGGKVTDYEGNTYDAYHRTLIASNGLIHNEFLQSLEFDDQIAKR